MGHGTERTIPYLYISEDFPLLNFSSVIGPFDDSYWVVSLPSVNLWSILFFKLTGPRIFMVFYSLTVICYYVNTQNPYYNLNKIDWSASLERSELGLGLLYKSLLTYCNISFDGSHCCVVLFSSIAILFSWS